MIQNRLNCRARGFQETIPIRGEHFRNANIKEQNAKLQSKNQKAKVSHRGPRGPGSAFGRNQKGKGRLLRIRRMFFFCLRLSFLRLTFLRRRRKADYGEKQKTKGSFLKKVS